MQMEGCELLMDNGSLQGRDGEEVQGLLGHKRCYFTYIAQALTTTEILQSKRPRRGMGMITNAREPDGSTQLIHD